MKVVVNVGVPDAHYFKLKPDGALWPCSDCKCRLEHDQVILACTPNGSKQLLCLECVDTGWLSKARFAGVM